ncbi:MAG TPA: hypothetical protein VIJ58_14060 [Candidatus Dormibacteraeota bacterium]
MAWTPALSAHDRVRVWAAQLAANDFPPTCAMTGAPAETWRKFQFSTAPAWAYLLLLLVCSGVGVLISLLIMYLVSRRASGYLPLTKASSRRIALASWIPGGLVIGTIAIWVLAAIVGNSSNNATTGAVAAVLVILSLLTLLAGFVGLLVVRPLIGPRGTVMEQQPGQFDRVVELRRVHPAFVAAVNQLHQARAAQYAAMQPAQGVPLPPGSI